MSRKTIIRTPQRTRTFIQTCQSAQDVRLSFEARGVLSYLLSQPPDWEVRVQDLMNAGNIGRDKVYRIIKELKTNGYLTRSRKRREDGTFEWGDYIVRDNPLAEQAETTTQAEKHPLPEKPYTDKPDTENTEIIHKRESTSSTVSADAKTVGGGEQATTRTDGQAVEHIEPKPRTEFQQVQDVLVELWFDGNTAQYGRAGKLAHVLLGTARAKGYREYNLKRPITAKLLRLFAADWRKRSPGISLPTSPETLNQHLYTWRKRHDAEIAQALTVTTMTAAQRAEAAIYGGGL